ncbi:MAG: LytTR family DNA-binding domain-containing protein [Bacteroidales bacterium]
MKALIIEDEILASRHLNQILAEVGDIDVIDTLESIAETIEWFGSNTQPDIVFMDIHLADGIAFEIFNHVKISCPIVFTTAYDEYALRAFKVNSVDYLLKPVEASDIQAALKKLKTLSGHDAMQNTLTGLVDFFRKEQKYKTHFLIPAKGDKLMPVKVSDLACFFIDTGIVKAVTFDNRSYRIDNTLDELSDMLDPADFFRANRQFIISRESVKDVDLWFSGRLSLNLKVETPEKIVLSKARVPEFKSWFSGKPGR